MISKHPWMQKPSNDQSALDIKKVSLKNDSIHILQHDPK